MVVIVLEDLPLSLHLVKVFFTYVSRCVSPFLRCFTSLIEGFPNHSCVFSDLGYHITVAWPAINTLYVQHNNIFAFSKSFTSFCFVFFVYQVRAFLDPFFVFFPLSPPPILFLV